MTTRTVNELESLLASSKGGNVPGITEDHRYEMMRELQAARAAKADGPSKMVDIICSALGTAMLIWCIAFALSFFGFEQAFLWMGAIALLWSFISAGCLIVGAVVWIARHVRVTIV